MPNIQISDLPNATLPLDSLLSFFEVQTVEGGEDVSRKISANDISINLPDGTTLGSIIVLDGFPDTYINNEQVIADGSSVFINTTQIIADGTSVQLRDSTHAGLLASLGTFNAGISFAGRFPLADPSVTSADGRLVFTDSTNGVQTWDLGHQVTLSAGLLFLRNHIETGLISLLATSGGGTFGDRTLFEGDPDGNSQIFHGASDAPVARTTTVGAGGLEVDNQATGPGFERVLTLVDLFGGALNDLSDVTLTAPATGSVLYKSAGDWLDTNAVDIDPTAAVQLRNNGVVRILTTANGATINASGALGLVTLFATASVASFYSQYNGTNGGVAIKNQNPGARLVQISTGGGEEDIWIDMVRNGLVAQYHNNVQMTRTVVIGSGGFEVNNTLTGAGFERVLTTADIGSGSVPLTRTLDVNGTANEIDVTPAGPLDLTGDRTWTVGIADDAIFPGNGAIEVPTGTTGEEPASENGRIRYDNTTSKMRVVEDESWIDMITDTLAELTDVTLTTPVTGGVLYKSAGNWLDTPAILIDPAADVKLHQATAEVARTLTAVTGGFEANNTLTGVGFRRALTEADALTDTLLSDTSIPAASFVTILTVRAEANFNYAITGMILLDVPDAGDDSSWRFTLPAGATGEVQWMGFDQTGAAHFRTTEGTLFLSNDAGGVSLTSYAFTGMLRIAGTAGDVDIDIAKLLDVGGDALAKDGSWMKLVPVLEAP